MPEYDEIVAAARTRKSELNGVIDQLGDRIEEITSREYNRALTPAQRAEVRELIMAQVAANHAKTELSYITLQTLDTSDELTRIINSLRRARGELDAKRDVIVRIGVVAATFTRILGGIDNLTRQVRRLLDQTQ